MQMTINPIRKNKRSFAYKQDALICPSCGKKVTDDELIYVMSGLQCPRCLGIYDIKEWLDNDET